MMPETLCIQFTNGCNQFCVKNKVGICSWGYLSYLLANASNKTLNILFVATNLENLTASLWACGLGSWWCWMCASMSVTEVVSTCSYHSPRWAGSFLFLLLRDVFWQLPDDFCSHWTPWTWAASQFTHYTLWLESVLPKWMCIPRWKYCYCTILFPVHFIILLTSSLCKR